MKIGLIGDIHANIDALEAVLKEMEGQDVTRIYCAGDIVGYGACPQECIDLIRSRNIPSVMGNHDCYTSQIGGNWAIRAVAKEAIYWTQTQLKRDYIDWLAALPRTLDCGGFTICHASHVFFPDWPYVVNSRAAIQHFLFQPKKICFNGHSHIPVFVRHLPGEPPEAVVLTNMVLPRRHQVAIGVGSVGQPRDGDPRSCALIYDDEKNMVSVMRVSYPIRKAQKRILDARLPQELADRLWLGQ